MDGIVNTITRKQAIDQGLPRYFTGKPCKHGHVVERYVLNWTCVTCHGLKCAEYQPKWRAANPHKAVEYGEKYAEKHKARNKEWRKKNRDRCAETQRAWNAKNREKRNDLSKKWRSENHSVMIAHVKKRKLDKLNRTPVWLTDDDFWMMSEMYHLAEIRTKITGIVWHVDHVIPLRGKTVSGFHVPSNLRVITAQENMKKGNRYAPR